MPKRPVSLRDPIATADSNPLAFAVSQRDRETLSMVARAIERRDVVLAFQPVVQTSRPDKPAFYEGLIRVLDDTGRVIPAKDFIETIETTELGRKIDCLTLEMGLMSLAEDHELRLSVNMSARSIGWPEWTKTLQRGLAADETVAERLILEITESSAMAMPELVSVFMQDMQLKGVSFALDDFGAGYTSFRYLREFYFDILKIDGQFITGIARNRDNQVLTQALMSIAQHFEMFTVAEAVESAEDAAWLAHAGIDCMQGYYFGAPTIMPPWKAPATKQAQG
ncbi:EAL domain-containing protein (putative c-di-GMP-specific phosphodiesterase class I) [Rhodobacter aestuarii]|uniref:EAL domain, c-di-GMP-specific phosphodiesterase class I (Or its enzymatically inactive variant) n=1 Tax=Rhodobacter aestuarii TaxID=453582 RepID=A0A1N7Q6E9_9RHOB|nr:MULTISPECIES: EAL domain-containing protein [Rhodobacter]PTV93851.1 EAL domain-containing protein (putative c-di-GMP-specific phosphodiesterase class I) [Rhodobacter aestuarii]SIT18425.1 EAL domain, c-di-GMP-specific phosphodiesterase class I (or its enzymatically inactive variant) [Rhodobacter aestuarii]SOC15542.1 EAL domain-containing protein (putative c-di-GMP-specific phosphodiesterase class I) [Rhodobacter sp. JA431]